MILEDLYAGTLDEAAWRRAILAIANSVRASGAILFAWEPQSGAILRLENFRLDPQRLAEYQKHWILEDIRGKYLAPVPTCIPVTERMLPMDPGWRRTSFLNEFLIPTDMPYFMPAWLHKSPGRLVTLSFVASRARGAFGREDVEAYRRVVPHVSRALEIRDRLERAQIRADALALHLNTLHFGTALLDAAGRVIEANALVEALLRTDCGIRFAADRTLRLLGPAGSKLAQWMLTGVPPVNAADGLLHVPRPKSLPLSVMVMPVPREGVSWTGRDPRWLVLIFDPECRIEASTDLIARDLGISNREAAVAAQLVKGCKLEEVAQRLSVSPHTVRCQLKSIFAKTGTHSQSDLIRRIAMGPSIAREHRSAEDTRLP